ncbi:hypothetical protein Tco_1094370 [Tanacetum coccineum]|uniref:Uncharacterized protein n=1 Tax=Tanacetum coccineum TaxID=301880 RepID=A0ABQ5IFI0_9ASTR
MLQIVPNEEVYIKALQVKYPIIDWEVVIEESRSYWKIIRAGNHTEVYQSFEDMLKKFNRHNLEKLWDLVKQRSSSTEFTLDKEKVLWVKLKRLFKPNGDDTLWKLQRYMHDPLAWRLYSTCGVHLVSSTRGHDISMLVPSCLVIFDLEPLSLSFYFVFASEIFKSLSFRLDRLCHLAILCLDQHAHTLHHLESLLTISLDRLDIFEGRSCISEFFEHEHVVMNPNSAGMRHHHLHLYIQRISLTGFPAQSVGSSNTDVLDLPCLLVLITGTSQSRQHGKSESDSYYLSDYVVNSFPGTSLIHIESHHRFFPIDTSLIHIESRKSPTKSLFDAGSSRISIFIVST